MTSCAFILTFLIFLWPNFSPEVVGSATRVAPAQTTASLATSGQSKYVLLPPPSPSPSPTPRVELPPDQRERTFEQVIKGTRGGGRIATTKSKDRSRSDKQTLSRSRSGTSNNQVEPSIKELNTAPPDLLEEERCAINEEVTITPQEGGTAPLRVIFDASASHSPCGRIVQWSWEFGDGSSGSGMKVIHTYNKPGTYIARVNITDNNGNTNLVELDYLINIKKGGKEKKE